ncbi:MAG: DUF962 domain-containing protein [Ideonella sp. WA131b]|jgi:uncharacterized membrane protein YGL010W|nr:DUF962 domain-containing protein [Ideonella sp. WA131b]
MASPFRPALTLLAQYADYHRDRRNIATHLVGVPMIMFGALVLLSRPGFELAGLALSPAWLLLAVVIAWTLSRGELALGLLTSAVWVALAAAAHALEGVWWAWGLGFFALGWVIQFVGHYYEGRKPAFVDDLVGLFVAPMFVLLELLAPAGFFKGLMAEVERIAGPTLLRDLAHPATR